MNDEFDTRNGRFILYDYETGKDWDNKLWNENGYLMTVSHLGCPTSRYVDAQNNQILLNCPKANFVYVRDEESKDYWNIGLFPAWNREASDFRCEHAMNYTSVSSVCREIAGQIDFAVSAAGSFEVWRVTVENRSKRPRSLSLFAMTAFDLNGYAQPVYYSSVTTSATEYLPDLPAVYCNMQNPYAPFDNCQGFIAASDPAAGYDGNLEVFLGTAGSHARPRVLEEGRDCFNSLATVRNRCGVVQNKLTLEPGEKKTACYFLGLTTSREALRASFPAMKAEAETLFDFEAAQEAGKRRFGHLRVKTPCERANRIFNFWAEKQVSFCHLGKKAVRDNAQLAMGMCHFRPKAALGVVEECVAHQYVDGHAVLTWYPYLEPNIYSDPSFWMILAVCQAVKETGDFGFLDKEIPYLDEGTDTVYGHLKRAAEWFLRPDNYGPHGLPRIHHADWNDALNIPDEQAESVLMAMFVLYGFSELAGLSERLGEKTYAEFLRKEAAKLSETVNRIAFNGDYYVRAFSKFGTVGDKGQAGGAIYVNPQVWAILAGIVPDDRLPKVLAAIDGMETEEGIPLCAPPYPTYDERVGRMSGMLPGVYENGGIYNHAGCFKVMADCKLKRKDHAMNTLLKIMPDGVHNPSSRTTTEPYVFTNCYLKHPAVDMMVGFSWQTGTSAWGLRCFYEGILGIQSDYDGLRIDPCLPDDWKELSAVRYFRGCRYEISYLNKGGNQILLEADGHPLPNNQIPAFSDGQTHRIKVELI